MNAPLYTIEILRLAASLEPPIEILVPHGQAEVRSPTCGSRISTHVQVDAEGRIAALSQDVHACAFGQASAALAQKGAIGRNRVDVEDALRSLTDWLEGTSEIGDWPGLDALAPARSRKGRHGAILLPFRALLAALDEVR